MVGSDMPALGEGNATNCEAVPKHLVHISGSSFQRDRPLQSSCGGAIMLSSAWLELHSSSVVGDGVAAASAAGAIASSGSALVLQDSVIAKHSAYARGGAVFALRGRFWATNTSFSDSSVVRNDGGGCLYIADATEVRVSGCSFDRCVAPGGGGAIYCQVMYDTFAGKPVIHISDSSFTRCRALQNGGVLSLQAYNMTVVDTLFANNEVGFFSVLCSLHHNRSPVWPGMCLLCICPRLLIQRSLGHTDPPLQQAPSLAAHLPPVRHKVCLHSCLPVRRCPAMPAPTAVLPARLPACPPAHLPACLPACPPTCPPPACLVPLPAWSACLLGPPACLPTCLPACLLGLPGLLWWCPQHGPWTPDHDSDQLHKQ
jgi:hypothetical protein